MSELKCKKKVVISVGYQDVEDLINKYYFNGSHEFSLCAAEESSNDSTLELLVDGKLDSDDKERIADRDDTYMTGVYLNDLCARGVVDKGDYLIDICW